MIQDEVLVPVSRYKVSQYGYTTLNVSDMETKTTCLYLEVRKCYINDKTSWLHPVLNTGISLAVS